MSDKKALQSCPFCGKDNTAKVFSSHENDDVDEEQDESFVVCCDASTVGKKGGCGASSGYQRTREKAADAWNKRCNFYSQPCDLIPAHKLD